MSSRIAHSRKSDVSEVVAISISRSATCSSGFARSYPIMIRQTTTAGRPLSSDLRSAGTPQSASATAAAMIRSTDRSRSRWRHCRASRCDQRAQQQRTRHAADAGADRIEEGDRKRANLQRKNLAHGQIGGARSRRGEEEHDHPGGGQRLQGEKILAEQIAGRASNMPDTA